MYGQALPNEHLPGPASWRDRPRRPRRPHEKCYCRIRGTEAMVTCDEPFVPIENTTALEEA